MNRVVITGIGVVSPVGIGREAFWSSLTAGRSGIGPITLFDASTFPVRIGGEVKGFDAAAVSGRLSRGGRHPGSQSPACPGGGRGSNCRCRLDRTAICATRCCAWAWGWRRSAWRT